MQNSIGMIPVVIGLAILFFRIIKAVANISSYHVTRKKFLYSLKFSLGITITTYFIWGIFLYIVCKIDTAETAPLTIWTICCFIFTMIDYLRRDDKEFSEYYYGRKQERQRNRKASADEWKGLGNLLIKDCQSCVHYNNLLCYQDNSYGKHISSACKYYTKKTR